MVKKEKEATVPENETQTTAIGAPAQPTLPDLPSMPDDTSLATQSTVTIDIENSPPQKKSKCALDDLFGEVFVVKVEQGKSLHDRVQLEIKNYRSEPALNLAQSPLHWWKVNEDKYPLLATFAKYILAIPATSVASERVFSTAGDIVTAQRATLQSNNVDMLIFLAKNLKPADL